MNLGLGRPSTLLGNRRRSDPSNILDVEKNKKKIDKVKNRKKGERERGRENVTSRGKF